MPDDVVTLAAQFRAELIQGDAAAVASMVRRWTAVEQALETAVSDLAAQLADLKAKGEEVPSWKLFQLRRYRALLAQVGTELATYSQWAAGQIQSQQAAAVALGDEHAKALVLASVEGERQAAVAWDKLPAGAVERIAAIAQGGKPLNQLLAAAYPTAAQAITNELITGTAVGRNPRETARQVLKKGLAQGLQHVLLVARDQQIRSYREMVRQRYDDSDVVYGYMRLAAKNMRTCVACLALDGSVYATNQLMALHPQDRCAMVPLVEGFPLPKWQTGEEWFKTLGEDEQRRMMGNGRYEAWRDGLFSFRQLATIGHHPTWGPSARVTSLTHLLNGRGGLNGTAVDPAVLLTRHKAKAPKPQKPQTLAIGKGDDALLTKLMDDLGKTAVDPAVYQAVKKALGKMLAGHQGFVYLDANGRLAGAIAYQTKQGNLQYLHATAAGFVDEATNLKALVDLAGLAQQQGQGIELYVPNAVKKLYQDWGFVVHQPLAGGARLRLRPDDVAGFLQDPAGYGQVKLAQLGQAALKALADPNAAFTFRSGQPIPGLPFKPVVMSDGDFTAQTKPLAYDPPLQLPDDTLHAAAGMLLFTPDGKLVVVDPAGQYGGYQTTFPKGTQEDGMSLQETAVKEVYEETGFQARVLGFLGDYEKTTSVTRFYLGVVEDGAPWAAHYETEAVRIVPLDQVDALLNVGTDKDILQDLLKLKDQVLEGQPFSIAALEAGLDKYAAAAGKLPPPPGSTPPAGLTKKALVEHLTKVRGVAKWKLSVASKEQVAALFDLPYDEALAAIDAFGAAHTAKYAKPKGPAKLPPPPEPPATLTKKALMEHLAQLRGIAQWKLSVMKKEDIVALFDMAEADALAAIEAAGQAHTQKYAGGKPKKEPKALPPEQVAFQKFQQAGATALSADEAQLALAHAQQAGEAKAVLATLKSQYQKQIGDPLVGTSANPATMTKQALVAELNAKTAVPIYKLNTLKKGELVGLVGRPVSQLHAAAGHPFQPQAAAPPPAAAAQAAPVPKAEPPPPPPPADPVDIQQWAQDDVVGFFASLEGSFTAGSPAAKGVDKAQTNVVGGHGGFAYVDDQGQAAGVVTFHDIGGGVLKVSGAAFTNTAVNQEAMADVANLALSQGKKLKTYVPAGLKATYKKWGFVEDGAYMLLQPGDMPAFVTASGKKPKAAPKPKPPAPSFDDDDDDGGNVIGTPMDVSAETAVKLKKDVLIAHLAPKAGVSPDKLQKYSKAMLVQFMEMDAFQAIDLMQKGAAPPPPAPPPKAPEPVPVVQKRPLPGNLPPFRLPDPPGFPADVSQMQVVKGLGGSTGAKLVEDPATGKRYVMKRGNSAGHLREEAYADAAYQALGFKVPAFKVYETADGPVKLAEYVAGGKTLGQALADATPAERTRLVKAVQRGFAADALMGNWDVIGASKDNVLVDKDGQVWRIDNGGSFRYRAQGAKKEKAFVGDYPVELWTMRDKAVGPENAQVFGGLDIYDVMDQVRDIVPKGEQLLAAVPEELRPMVHGRLEVMRDLLGTSDAFRDDKWQAGYTDGFLEQSTYIRREGLIDAMPQQLKQAKAGSTTVYDEQGREFDVLRGKGSHVEAWAAYCKANGGDPAIIRHWMGQQAGSSWSDASQALKYRIALERGGHMEQYYWHSGIDYAKKQYEATIKKVGQDTYHKTWAMWHAWVYESLRHVDFKRKQGGIVELVRTEGTGIMAKYGVKMGAKNVSMLRGAAESGSIYRAKKIVAGGEVTRQRVPIHRVLGYYWGDRPGAQNNYGGFLGDAENEFVFIPEGIPFDYVDSITGSKGVEAYW